MNGKLSLVLALGVAFLVLRGAPAPAQQTQVAAPTSGRYQMVKVEKDGGVVFDTATGLIHVIDDLERGWTVDPVHNAVSGLLPTSFLGDRPMFREQLCENAADAINEDDWAALRACLTESLGRRADLDAWAAGLRREVAEAQGQEQGPDAKARISKNELLKRATFTLENGALRISAVN